MGPRGAHCPVARCEATLVRENIRSHAAVCGGGAFAGGFCGDLGAAAACIMLHLITVLLFIQFFDFLPGHCPAGHHLAICGRAARGCTVVHLPGVHGARCGAARCAKDRLITVRSCRHEPASSSWRRWEQRRLFAGRGASHCCLRCSVFENTAARCPTQGPAQRAPSSSWAASGASTSWWAECCCGSAPRCRRRS